MPESGTDRPALDAILEKVLEAVPFQLTMDGGAEAARARFAALPRRAVHPDLRTEDRSIAGVPVRVYCPQRRAEPADRAVPARRRLGRG
jgi:hypothetical protein